MSQPTNDTPETPPVDEPKKSTDAEIEIRVAKVYDMLIEGTPRPKILQFGSTTWGVSDRTTDEYIKRAKTFLVEQNEKDRDLNRALAIQRLNNIYFRCMKVQDFQRAIAAQKELNQLQDLYAPTRMEHSGVNGEPIQFEGQVAHTIPERMAEIAAFLKDRRENARVVPPEERE